jgi:glycosyltransferase involved in cell wall biosynthesis
VNNCLRVAFIFNYLTPYRITFFEKLCSNQEYEWLVVHGEKEKDDGRPTFKGILNFPNRSVKYFETKVGPFHVRWQKGIMPILKEWKPDIVITLGITSNLTNWLAMDWAHRNGAKTITWHCGWEEQAGNHFSFSIKRLIARKYLTLVDHILVYSTKGASYLAELLGERKENITICYNGLEIDHLLEKENEIRAKGQDLRLQQRVDEKKIFLYVGGMLADKRVPLLLKAFNQLPQRDNVILWLVGDGPDISTIKELAKTMKMENIKFWGRVIEDVDVYFAASNYFVMPGIGGLALNQALFWKLPCIVSEADGTEDDLIFENKTGFRFIPNDENSLKIALQKCVALPDEQKNNFGIAGRRLVLERSNVNEMVKTFLTAIQQLTQKESN